ncbi:hypothetical protein QEN19_001786 [Hanseniaspora menglaensis]
MSDELTTNRSDIMNSSNDDSFDNMINIIDQSNGVLDSLDVTESESKPGKKSVDTVLPALDKLQNDSISNSITKVSNNNNNNIMQSTFEEQILLANTLTSLSRGSSPVSHSIYINKNINQNNHNSNNNLIIGSNGGTSSPFPSMNTVLPFNAGTLLTNGNRNNSTLSTTSSVASNNSVLFPPTSPNLLFFNNMNQPSNIGGSLPGPLGNVFPASGYNTSTINNNQSNNTNANSNNVPMIGTPVNNNIMFSRNNIISAETPPLGTLHNIKYGNAAVKGNNSYFNNTSNSNLSNINPESVNTGTIFGNGTSNKNMSLKVPVGGYQSSNQIFGSFSSNNSANNSPMPGQGYKNSSYYNNPSTLTNSLYSSMNANGQTSSNLLQTNSPISGNYGGINPLFTQNSQLLANSGVSRPRSPRQVNIKFNNSKTSHYQQPSTRLENLKFGSLTPTMGSSPELSVDLDQNSFESDESIDNQFKRKRQKTSVNSTPRKRKIISSKDKAKQIKPKKKKKSINDYCYIIQPSTGMKYKVMLKNLIKELEPADDVPSKDSTIQSNETFTNDQGVKQYQCHICLKIFQSGHHLTRHKTSVHSVIKSFECLRCGKQFKRKDHAWQHVCKKLSCPFQSNAAEDLFHLGEVCGDSEEEDNVSD